MSFAVVLADARPAELLARSSLAVVLAQARPAALLADAPCAVVLAHACIPCTFAFRGCARTGSTCARTCSPRRLLALRLVSSAVLLADARPAALLSPASLAVC